MDLEAYDGVCVCPAVMSEKSEFSDANPVNDEDNEVFYVKKTGVTR